MTGSDGLSAGVVPRMLPPRPWLADRDNEKQWGLTEAADAERDEAPCLLWLTGVPGVGKSALAVSLAYMLMGRCPDGQFYYELGGSTADGPVNPAEVLAAFLRQLGVPRDEIPDSLIERQASFRNKTFGRRVLLVLDDAASLPQVKELLPSSRRAVVIVTSIARHTGTRIAGFDERNLDELDPSFSTELVARYLGDERVANEPEATEELISVCGRLPLGLEVMCGVIASRPHRRLADFVAPLAADPARTYHRFVGDSRLFVPFDFVLRSHSDDLARAYLTLSLHYGPAVRVRVAAGMLGCPMSEAQDVLDDLVQANLLKRLPDGGYRFHAFAAWYVRQRADEELAHDDRVAAVRALVRCRLEWAVGLARSLWPGRPWIGDVFTQVPPTYVEADVQKAAAELQSEQANFRAAIDAAAHIGLAAECAYLALALKQWFYEIGQPADLVPMMEHAAHAAETLDDMPLIIRMQNELGSAYEAAERFDEAILAFDRSEVLARLNCNMVAVASALEWKGIVEGQRGALDRAMELLREARTIAMSAAYDAVLRPRTLALLNMHMGRILECMHRHEEAAQLSEAAMHYFRDHAEPANAFRAALTLNDALVPLGRIREANAHLTGTMDGIDDARFRPQRLRAWQAMATNGRALGELTGALTCLKRAAALARDLGLVTPELTNIVSIADLHAELGNTEAAEQVLRHARDTAATLGVVADRIALLRAIAAIYEKLGHGNTARACRTDADTLARQLNDGELY